jgi:hypothetical protein
MKIEEAKVLLSELLCDQLTSSEDDAIRIALWLMEREPLVRRFMTEQASEYGDAFEAAEALMSWERDNPQP